MHYFKSVVMALIVAGILFSGDLLFACSYPPIEIIDPEGLDQIAAILAEDEYLHKKVDETAILAATASALGMNNLIKEAVYREGLANDGVLSTADVMQINRYLNANCPDLWTALRGTEESDSGYCAVERKSYQTKALNTGAIDHVWGKFYDLGFPAYNQCCTARYNGEKSGSFSDIASKLNEVMRQEILSGALTNGSYEEVTGTTGTALDDLLALAMQDPGLHRKVAMGDMREAVGYGNQMNHLILEAIWAEGLANDGKLTPADIRTINLYLVANHRDIWAALHGDDEDDSETGYHLIQNDGATSRMFADNVVNSILDGIYHLGFYTSSRYALVNEDGKNNKSFEKIAWWLDTILHEELKTGILGNPEYTEVEGTTGTTFDRIIPVIYRDEGLLLYTSMNDIREGARAANAMNTLIVAGIRDTGIADDAYITHEEVKKLNQYLVDNHQEEWKVLHGDDDREGGIETGFHRIQNDGARGIVNNRNIINTLADGVYHLGFSTPHEYNLVNEDGKKNASFKTIAYWMNKYLKEDLENGLLTR